MLIDTNIAIHLRDDDPSVVDRIGRMPDIPMLSVFSLIELEGGVFVTPAKSAIRRHRLDAILAYVPLLAFDMAVVPAYATIVRDCGFSRPRILDRLIAATAIVAGMTLITMNPADFRDIPDLKLEIWPAPPQ